MPRQLSPHTLRQIGQLAKTGHSTSQIAREVGCDRHTVARHLSERAEANPIGHAAPQLSPAEVSLFRSVLASFRAFDCECCGGQVVTVKAMSTGRCPACGATWQIQIAKVGGRVA